MRKRPLCIAALIWAVILWLLGKAGIPVLGYDPPDLPIDAKTSLFRWQALFITWIPMSINLYFI